MLNLIAATNIFALCLSLTGKTSAQSLPVSLQTGPLEIPSEQKLIDFHAGPLEIGIGFPPNPSPDPKYPTANNDPTVAKFAKTLAFALQTSKSLAPFTVFDLVEPDDMFFRITVNYMDRAGFCDPKLAKVGADAADQAGHISAPLYFDTIGFTAANFFKNTKVLTPDNVDMLVEQIKGAVRLVACMEGVKSIETMMNAVVFGVLDVMKDHGLATFENVKSCIYLFKQEITSLLI